MLRKIKRIVKEKAELKRNQAWYYKDYRQFLEMADEQIKSEFQIADSFPCLYDKYASSGVENGVYFQQDMYVAREIYKANPQKHVDIGSRIDGFVAHVAVFRSIEVFDIREQKSIAKNITFKQGDLMKLDENLVNYCDSLSCLHTIEHFGLGRYSDSINPQGHIIGFDNMLNIVNKEGRFYISMPMGEPNRIEFNAHRVFCLRYLVNWLTPKCTIEKFAYIDDNHNLHEDVELSEQNIQNSCGCTHGCALFTLRKN